MRAPGDRASTLQPMVQQVTDEIAGSIRKDYATR